MNEWISSLCLEETEPMCASWSLPHHTNVQLLDSHQLGGGWAAEFGSPITDQASKDKISALWKPGIAIALGWRFKSV